MQEGVTREGADCYRHEELDDMVEVDLPRERHDGHTQQSNQADDGDRQEGEPPH